MQITKMQYNIRLRVKSHQTTKYAPTKLKWTKLQKLILSMFIRLVLPKFYSRHNN